MTTHRPDSDRLDPTAQQGAVQDVRLDPTWSEHHWIGRMTPSRRHRPPVERRIESGLDVMSINIVRTLAGL